MISYFFEVSICWLLLYLFYAFFLSSTTFFNANRWYLITCLLIGVVLPLVELPAPTAEVAVFQANYLAPITIGMETVEQQVVHIQARQEFNYLGLIFYSIYTVGFLLALIRLLKGLFEIWKIYKEADIYKKEAYYLVSTNKAHLPFSFFNYLFWSKEMPSSLVDDKKILEHELAHIRGRHSLDVLLLECFLVVFWWNPLVYFYRRSIRITHEFLADKAALQYSNKKQYGQLLLRQFQSGLCFALANNFIHSQLKKRIKMITKTKSGQLVRLNYILIIPVLFGLLLLFSGRAEGFNTFKSSAIQLIEGSIDKEAIKAKLGAIISKIKSSSEEDRTAILTEYYQTVIKQIQAHPNAQEEILEIQSIVAQRKGEYTSPSNLSMAQLKQFATGNFDRKQQADLFSVVEEMPRFPGCEEGEMTTKEHTDCANKKLLEFVYMNIKYPKRAKEENIEGVVVIQFTIKKDGAIRDAKIMREIGGGCGRAALAVIEKMPNWIPGKQRGKAVDVQFNIPIKFKLEGKINEEEEAVFKVVEQMPLFPGCTSEEMSREEKTQCSNMAMLQFVFQNLKYPKTAKERGLEGTVVAKFVVDTDGRLIDEEIIRSVDSDMDAEVINVIDLMNEMPELWTPGRQNGKAVKVEMILPVKFKMEPKAATETKEPQRKTEIATLNLSNFRLSPNPTNGIVDLRFEKKEGTPLSIQVTDASGRAIFIQEVEAAYGGIYSQQIQLKGKEKGMYFLKIIQDGKSFTEKIVLQ